jgi:hypothetical protein
MNEPDSKLRQRALAIEYWIATFIVFGAFIVGLGQALSYLL